MTNTTAHSLARSTTVCTMLMPPQARAMMKRKHCCKFKRRIRNGLPGEALQAIITAAAMGFLRKHQF